MLALIPVVLVCWIFWDGPSFAKSTFSEALEVKNLLVMLAAAVVISGIASVAVSGFLTIIQMHRVERYETPINRPLALLGSNEESGTWFNYHGDNNTYEYLEFKYYAPAGGLVENEIDMDYVSVVVDPTIVKPHVAKATRYHLANRSPWLWNFTYGNFWTLYVPNAQGVSDEVLREILVKE
jgi:hypothetical protein